ncbi:hypothetical protein [Agrococcus jejuensis]|uniref:hypothetical protein n=1 Tax=Agrococcus jejuensis TaxID=399736 RepID=UPI0011A831C2|nr:hypothetical protein [Agrococcus jejuensis]
MDLCVLPQTGAAEHWLLIGVVAAVLIAAGIALAVSGRARRSVLTGLGALAIIGALVAGGIGGAAPAQADAGSASCVTTPAPVGDEVSAATLVAPGIPTATAQCAAEPTVQIPSTQGVSYTQARTGTTLTVTAVPAAGYAFAAGATTTWSFDMTATTAAPWPVDLPVSTQATPTEAAPDGGSYLTPVDAALVPALQQAADAGLLAYSLDGSQFALAVEFLVVDRETGDELARPVASVPVPSTLSYDFERGDYLLDFDGNPGDELFEQLTEQIEAIEAQYPDAFVVPAEDGLPFTYPGLRILASYSPGAGCETVSAVVPIELVLPQQPIPGDAPRLAPDALLQGLDDVLDTQPEAAPASEAPASEAPASEAPATEEPAAPSEADAAPASDEEVVEPTPPADER